MPSSITTKIEQILADDRNFSTRTGLRFTLELLRDSFAFIESEKERTKQEADKTKTLESRIGHVETTLNKFLDSRRIEQDKAEDERKFYRRAVIGGIISILLLQAATYFFK
jgi:hypothetical protein